MGANKILVAIESTDDFVDKDFHAELKDFDIRNEDGSYGKVQELYRVVGLTNEGFVVPINNAVFKSFEEAEASVDRNNFSIINYDRMIDKAWEARMAYKANEAWEKKAGNIPAWKAPNTETKESTKTRDDSPTR